MQHLGKTPSFRGPRGEYLPGSIAEIQYLKLGGIDQWVMIRGENVSNAPLILLHGGPGLSETGLFRHFNAPLERSFTVVYWDQRGAGRSYDPGIPRASMTIERFIGDLDELVGAVCKRLGQDKVVIFGHSWGSTLGVLYTARFPHKVAAYVGCGQVGDAQEGERRSYTFALAEAQRLRNRRALRALRAIGPPPHRPRSLWIERMWLQRLEGELSPASDHAYRLTLDAMWPEVSKVDLTRLAPALEVPVFFFLGRKDHVVPAETSVAYLDALTAPSKQLVWFEHSGHEPFMDEAARFNTAMVERVRPVV